MLGEPASSTCFDSNSHTRRDFSDVSLSCSPSERALSIAPRRGADTLTPRTSQRSRLGHILHSHARQSVAAAKRTADAFTAAGFEISRNERHPVHLVYREVVDDRRYVGRHGRGGALHAPRWRPGFWIVTSVVIISAAAGAQSMIVERERQRRAPWRRHLAYRRPARCCVGLRTDRRKRPVSRFRSSTRGRGGRLVERVSSANARDGT